MSILFEPFELGSLQVKNRFVHAATYSGLAAETGEVSDELVKRYGRLARGEVGLIISGHLNVHPLGRAARNQAGIYDDAMLAGLTSGSFVTNEAILSTCPPALSKSEFLPARLAKIILSLSKDDFCGVADQDPLAITLRQAQGDCSLDTN
jgi:hypothetical protein